MPRELVLGNGQLLVNLDSGLNIRDIYYPRVGELNHVGGNRNSVGVWVDGQFSWCDQTEWERTLDYMPETLITDTRVLNRSLGIELRMNDLVHHCDNFFLKKLAVKNLAAREREIRFFFTHDLSIDESEVGDTAAYEPALKLIYHYKRNRYFMFNGESRQGGIFQFSTGVKRFGHAEGTWRDAEDGRLEGNTIAQGSVDSTVSFRLVIGPGAEETLYYWMTIGHNFQEARNLNYYILEKTPERIINEVAAYWRTWVNKNPIDLADLPSGVVRLYKRSLLIVRTQIDRGGAILAANDSDVMQFNRDHYSYMWPRDGALIAEALSLAGYCETVAPFFLFCDNALTDKGYLLHKYNPDGSVGSSWHPWFKDGEAQLPIQEDETALVIYSLWEHYRRHKDLEFVQSLYRSLIKPAADFMTIFINRELALPMESYDLWEERRGIFTFTACAVYAGLMAAANFARIFADEEKALKYELAAATIKQGIMKHLYDNRLGRFLRGIYVGRDGSVTPDTTLESSLYSLFAFGVFPPDDPRVAATMQALADGLWVKTQVGGIARYTGDYYFRKSDDLANVPGNPWFVCTLWLAQWQIAVAKSLEDLQQPLEKLKWVEKHAFRSGVLPEQLHPYTGEALSVAPLTWSHGTFIYTVLKYVAKYNSLER